MQCEEPFADLELGNHDLNSCLHDLTLLQLTYKVGGNGSISSRANFVLQCSTLDATESTIFNCLTELELPVQPKWRELISFRWVLISVIKRSVRSYRTSVVY